MATRPRGGLGKGLNALFPGTTAPAVSPDGAPAGIGAIEVPIDAIEPNPRQPRHRMDPEQLADLAGSIREHGIIQPLIVTRAEAPGRYQLIAGERRWQAAKLAGLERVPVLVKEATPQASLEIALVENIQRADLNALEEAVAYRQLMDEFGLTQELTAQRVGRSRVAVANTVRLLNLPEPAREALAEGRISEGHARALLALPSEKDVRDALKAIGTRSLSVRQVEEWVRRRTSGEAGARHRRQPEEVAGMRRTTEQLEQHFQDALGTRVELTRSERGGRLTIHFYSEEELQALYDRIVLGVLPGAGDEAAES